MASSSTDLSSTVPSFSGRTAGWESMVVGFDRIPELEGQTNYTIWEASLRIIFRTLKIYDIVVTGAAPATDATEDEVEAYDDLCNHAKIVFIQMVSTPILEKIVVMENPHAIWN